MRAWTAFESEDYVMEAPNFWSRYMDTKVECSLVGVVIGPSCPEFRHGNRMGEDTGRKASY